MHLVTLHGLHAASLQAGSVSICNGSRPYIGAGVYRLCPVLGRATPCLRKVQAFKPSRLSWLVECLLVQAEVTADAVGEPLRELALLISCWPSRKNGQMSGARRL